MSAVAYADPSLDLATSLQDAEDRMGAWLSRAGRVVHIERPDGRTFHATAYERDAYWRRVPVLSAAGDTQCFAIEELALRGVQEKCW
jgi:hypothetical protein